LTAGELLAYLGDAFSMKVPAVIVPRLRATPTSGSERAAHRALRRKPSIRRPMWINWESYRGHAASPVPGIRGVGLLAFVVLRWCRNRLRDLRQLVRQ